MQSTCCGLIRVEIASVETVNKDLQYLGSGMYSASL